ncbi:MAG TPA: GntR family transcriptional regulator [Chloroflexota bacterium]|nr:GntR family transcriptional regulator [Chloroflexota bacterium]
MSFDPSPVHDRALRHSVTDYVLDAVRAGRLAPGDRVHETSLAKALEVSLSPVRESLFRLADQGWLEHRPRRGFYVRSYTPAETQEIYTFRALLEGFAARTVAARWVGGVPDEDLALKEELRRLIVEGEREAGTGGRLAVGRINARFHDCLIRLAGNGLLQRSWAQLAPAEWLLIPTWGSAPQVLAPGETADWVARHERVLALLESGDPDAAAQELEGHVREAGEANLRRRFTRTESTATAQAAQAAQAVQAP